MGPPHLRREMRIRCGAPAYALSSRALFVSMATAAALPRERRVLHSCAAAGEGRHQFDRQRKSGCDRHGRVPKLIWTSLATHVRNDIWSTFGAPLYIWSALRRAAVGVHVLELGSVR